MSLTGIVVVRAAVLSLLGLLAGISIITAAVGLVGCMSTDNRKRFWKLQNAGFVGVICFALFGGMFIVAYG